MNFTGRRDVRGRGGGGDVVVENVDYQTEGLQLRFEH